MYSPCKAVISLEVFRRTVLIREFQETDIGQVFNLACSVFDEQYRPEVFLYFHSVWPQGQLVVQSPEGRILGFIFGAMTEDGKCRVMLLSVTPMMRGLGIGGRLIREFEARATVSGSNRIMLELRYSKTRLLEFYRRMGFVVEGVLPAYYSDGEDGILMSKPIQWNI